MSRAKKQDIIYQERLNIPKEFLRFATPRDVSKYRAERLKCNVLIEIGAGVGGQTIAFSKTCKKVIAIEIDKIKSKILSDNLKKLKINNVEVINGDALNKSVLNKISKERIDIVFTDTQRPEQAERTLENIQPSIKEILKTYSQLTDKIAIEIPPYTNDLEKLKEYSFEEEFISLEHQLNRLTLYFNSLKKTDKQIISLPSEEAFISEKNFNCSQTKKTDSIKNFKFICAIDPTIIVSNCLEEFICKFQGTLLSLNKPVLLSNNKINSNFLTQYKIIASCVFTREDVLEHLLQYGAGKVILRYNLDPEKYWKERRFYESKLKGRKEINLFVNESKNQAILCEKL
jgi:16S rRNA G966 N2-methylase RsmD